MKGDERHGREVNSGVTHEKRRANDISENPICDEGHFRDLHETTKEQNSFSTNRSPDQLHEDEVCSATVWHQPLKAVQPPQQCPAATVSVPAGASARKSNPTAAPGPFPASAMECHFHESNQGRKAKRTDAPIGFSGGFGRVSGVVDSEDELTHPLGFSNCNRFVACSDNSYNKGSFLSEIQKTLEMGKAMGYNLEGCYDRVKEIVEGNGDKMVLR
ncbi:unnamed protein product [Lactuca virosa]|uniref:Uncharacterized protein n=1 Tax=Lactuca virosa TaxID=75947 RepID=A0AAU9PSI0_9ASTR|nr:unnamed protein product [Lactuca virosa]